MNALEVRRLDDLRAYLEKKGHRFSRSPLRCDRCECMIGVLAQWKKSRCQPDERKSLTKIKKGMTKEQRRQAAISIVDSWLTNPSGYDKRVWPKLARAIEQNRLSYRKRLTAGHLKRNEDLR